jgi:hypothetical protein
MRGTSGIATIIWALKDVSFDLEEEGAWHCRTQWRWQAHC